MNQTLLSFSIGPVQDFIAAARTTRDLWTGSYLLSWLTAHAMAAVTSRAEKPEGILVPDVSDNPLYAVACRREPTGDILSPCLPHTFLARVNLDAEQIRKDCISATQQQWTTIAAAVHDKLQERWRDWPGWDYRWTEQIEDFWDIRVLAVPIAAIPASELQRILGRAELDELKLQRDYLLRLAAADKAVRHYARHEFDEIGQGDTRPKCSLMGSFADQPRKQGRKQVVRIHRHASIGPRLISRGNSSCELHSI